MTALWSIAPRRHNDLVAQILENRGIDPALRDDFLSPDWNRDTHSSFAFTRMQEAVDRVFCALSDCERIVIHGDYDADGVCGSSLLFGAMTEVAGRLGIAADLHVYLPDRERDGYGVALHTVERLAKEGAKLLVTVDCGIANGLELDRGFELGVDAIVCDHHQLGTHLPTHATLLHPLAPGETYPNKALCGTGVAFKFASALVDEARKRGADFPEGYEKWFLDLVAIATVTDVMPLTGENRALEYFGLKVLNKTRRPGLRAILAASGTEMGSIDTQAIGFRIGPRLNAAGRLASARLAFDAVTAPSIGVAEVAAGALEKLNRERQNIFASSYDEAREMVQSAHAAHSVLVLSSTTWLPGIVGLIAGRLVSDFGKPAFVLTEVEGKFVGSGRTAGGLHLVKAMEACGDIFLRKGGHPQACGLTVASIAHIEMFRERVNAFAKDSFGAEGPQTSLAIDAVVAPSTCTLELIDTLMACAPFGEGNRPPVFADLGAMIVGIDVMGSTGKHVRVTLRDSAGNTAKMVGFGFADRMREYGIGSVVDIAYAPGVNVWNGRREVQCRIEDIRKVV